MNLLVNSSLKIILGYNIPPMKELEIIFLLICSEKSYLIRALDGRKVNRILEDDVVLNAYIDKR